MTESEWADSLNGGKVDQADGGDILFTSSNGTTKLDHEIESYDNTTGALVAWVEVPTLSYNMDIDIYIYYDNTTGVVDQWDINGTWDEGGSNNFKAVWHLDEETAGTGSLDLYQDSTSNLNHGDDFVSATLQTGQVDGGQEFNGSSDYVDTKDNALDLTGQLTISGWIFRETNASTHHITSKNSSTSTTSPWQLAALATTNQLRYFGKSGPATFEALDSTDTVGLNGWHHVAIVRNATQVTFYIDGNPDSGGWQAFSVTPTASDVTAKLGSHGDGSGNHFDGFLDEIRISDTSRSGDWIATEHDNQVSLSTFFKPLGNQETNNISPAGKEMTLTLGSGAATLTFDTTAQDAYWYSDLTYPTGQDDATIAAGSYTLNMNFSALPASQSWWDTNDVSRKQLTVSAGASSIPADYPVRLEFDHSALTLAQSLASGDDIRIAYFNGATWSELDRALFDDGITSSS